ncbi:hypothetical protein LKD72_18215 [Fusicatenibacter sp. CLA-AA-H213]|nr:hypothetical protein [Fusicatenibacter sp. CLA-AA-H213]
MKNVERAALLAATGVLAVGMAGCGDKKAPTKTDQGPTQETKTEDQESEEVSWTEADVAVAVAGMDNVTVVQGAKDPNLLHGITYDGDIVENIEAQSDMDLDTPGTYKVTYQVTVNAEKLAEYLTVDDASTESVVEEQENLDPEPEKEATKDDTDIDSAYTVDDHPTIEVEKEVTVVGKGTATDMADQDRIVISDGNTTVAKSDGSIVEEEVKVPESTEKKGTVAIDAVTKEEVSGEIPEETVPEETTKAEEEDLSETEAKSDTKSDKKSETKKNSKTDKKESATKTDKKETVKSETKENAKSETKKKPGSSGTVTTPAATVKPTESTKQEAAHTHKWVQQYKTETIPAKTHTVHHDAEYKTVHHDAVTHEEPIYEGHYVCTVCGLDMGRSESALDAHGAETGHGYSVEQVQVGTRTVTDQAAYDEKVLVKDAYDETVVDTPESTKQVPNGYKCSECGATK